MTVVTIKCAKCGFEMDSIELDSGVVVCAVDPCPTCLAEAFQDGMEEVDSEIGSATDDDWDDDEDDWDDEYDEDEDEDYWDGEDYS